MTETTPKRKTLSVTKKEIIKYWQKQPDKPSELDLNFDWNEAHEHLCWNCGETSKTTIERCHIVPRQLGGEDVVSNLVLLCKRCHNEAPDTSNPENMWEWIKSNKIQFAIGIVDYNFHKALEKFEDKQGYSFIHVITGYYQSKNLKIDLQSAGVFLDEFVFLKVGYHNGRVSLASYYYQLLNVVNELVEQGITFEKKPLFSTPK